MKLVKMARVFEEMTLLLLNSYFMQLLCFVFHRFINDPQNDNNQKIVSILRFPLDSEAESRDLARRKNFFFLHKIALFIEYNRLASIIVGDLRAV